MAPYPAGCAVPTPLGGHALRSRLGARAGTEDATANYPAGWWFIWLAGTPFRAGKANAAALLLLQRVGRNHPLVRGQASVAVRILPRDHVPSAQEFAMNRSRILILTLVALSGSALLSTATSMATLGPGIVQAYWGSVGAPVGSMVWKGVDPSSFGMEAGWALLGAALLTILYMQSDRQSPSRIRVVRRSARQRKPRDHARVAA